MNAISDLPASCLRRLVAWRRVRFVLFATLPFGLVFGVGSTVTPLLAWVARAVVTGLAMMLAYGWVEQWPVRLPAWLARWVLQLLGVVVAAPIGAYAAMWLTSGGDPQLLQEPTRLNGFRTLCFCGVLFGPWLALGAMVRQREGLARHLALGFELERSELQRQALDARLRLLQAQVQPHFLFNTLANVRALVNVGSPRAPALLDSLIAYLRAAVPRLNEPSATVAQELALVRAYLALMHMRMPDRLHYAVHADETTTALRCPAMALLSLVENAVRHGIDPSEEGGRIEVCISRRGQRCTARVLDTGVGLQCGGSDPPGTGLAMLRERMLLAFAGDARLSLTALMPHGVCAELEFPAETAEESESGLGAP
ncbi:histidine kinase [Ideonella azotifigens]|uniref:Signal transduction histidine kinase internal region domain-containing protein n=1 Tax=Ideonella azotifigens TaxID=513160 RepID=A0ABN1K7B5_9BURK|nr:histidine kinase [Ideonella azotifigens]MCD2342272.1 histidine kinase [Ideonella azotifigens]